MEEEEEEEEIACGYGFKFANIFIIKYNLCDKYFAPAAATVTRSVAWSQCNLCLPSNAPAANTCKELLVHFLFTE